MLTSGVLHLVRLDLEHMAKVAEVARNFSLDFPTDPAESMLINETLARAHVVKRERI